MKNKDLKKGRESIIGKIIYGFLLFMPLIAIGVTCLVNTFNNQAKQETTYNTQYETNAVNELNDLRVGNIYCMEFTHEELSQDLFTSNDLQKLPYASFVKVDNVLGDTNSFVATDYDNIMIRYRYSSGTLYVSNINGVMIYNYNVINVKYYFVYSSVGSDWTNGFFDYIKASDYLGEITNIDTHNIDTQEVFYRAVDKVTESPLFNWAENSIIYTGIENTCTQLSITTPFIPLLLAYWLIISVIYILYDIILMILIILHNKVHQIQNSI